MPRVTTFRRGPTLVVEVDGRLDVVAGHDLRATFGEALGSTTGAVSFDLSRVTGVDAHGLTALAWCTDEAVARRRVLHWATCSAPLVHDLRFATYERRSVHKRLKASQPRP